VIVFVTSRTRHGLVQTLLIWNPTGQFIAGPLYLVLDRLTKGAKLKNATGTTQTHVRVGDPYLLLPLAQLAPGQSFSVTLNFSNSGKGAITFTPLVIFGPGIP
jgi:hypothetical protein